MSAISEHDQWDIVTSIGLTALLVAAGRAVDTNSDTALVEDPWAERFVQAAHPPFPMPTRPTVARDDSEDEQWQMMSAYVGLRTRWFDRYFADATDAGVRQAVILAAGLDARAVRLAWPEGTRVFEVDQSKVLQFKDEVLRSHGGAPACDRRVVPVDLRDDWYAALLAAGFDPAAPTAWLAEGLLPYLPGTAQEQLLQAVTDASAPHSRFAIEDFANLRQQVDDPAFRRISRSFGIDMTALLSADDREDAQQWLRRHDWTVSAERAGDLADAWGRDFDPLTRRLNAECLFLTATR